MVSVCVTLDSIGIFLWIDLIGLDLMLVIAVPPQGNSKSSQERWGFFMGGLSVTTVTRNWIDTRKLTEMLRRSPYSWLTAYSHTDGSQVGDKRSIY